MKACALVHDVYVKCDMNAMLRLGAIATVCTWSMFGELKKGIDHPCFGMTRGRPITTFGPMATMVRGFIFEGLMYAPIRNLIAVVGGL